MKPERVQTRAAAAITGLKLRQVQWMAAQGKIPGAAKLSSRWTFTQGIKSPFRLTY